MFKVSIILTFFTISLAYAHPNHTTFDNIQHNSEQTADISTVSNKMKHNSTNENLGHSDIIPCMEQHKIIPCKKQ